MATVRKFRWTVLIALVVCRGEYADHTERWSCNNTIIGNLVRFVNNCVMLLWLSDLCRGEESMRQSAAHDSYKLIKNGAAGMQ